MEQSVLLEKDVFRFWIDGAIWMDKRIKEWRIEGRLVK